MILIRRKTDGIADGVPSKMKETATEGWLSAAESFIVDGIVAALKNHPAANFCWLRTGPSLRLLNKHWCRETNRHILSVRLRGKDQEEAVPSLLKFPNLTSVSLSSWSTRRVPSQLIRTLHKIPKLNRLVADNMIMASVNKADLDGLVCETIKLSFVPMPVKGWLDDLLKLLTTKMERLCLDTKGRSIERGWTTSYLALVPSVKRLRIDLYHDEDFETLAALDELQLTYHGDSLHRLAMLRSLVCLKVTVPVDSFEVFKALEKLKVLNVMLAEDFDFNRSFYLVIRRLKGMMIRRNGRGFLVDMPPEFLKETARMERLSVSHAAIDTSPFDHVHLGELQELSLYGCRLHGGMIPWNRLTALTRLVLAGIMDRDGTFILGLMDFSPLKKLRSLELAFDNEDVCQESAESIKSLTNLEILRMSFSARKDRADVRPLVQELRGLPHLMDTDVEHSGFYIGWET